MLQKYLILCRLCLLSVTFVFLLFTNTKGCKRILYTQTAQYSKVPIHSITIEFFTISNSGSSNRSRNTFVCCILKNIIHVHILAKIRKPKYSLLTKFKLQYFQMFTFYLSPIWQHSQICLLWKTGLYQSIWR